MARKGNKPDQRIKFAAVPYVNSVARLTIGNWTLWPNKAGEWTRFCNRDLTWFMGMYRTSGGARLASAGSVLTWNGKTPLQGDDKFEDALVAFATVAWLQDEGGSDSWLHETWVVDANISKNDSFRRIAKFSVDLTSVDREKVYPTRYCGSVRVSNTVPEEILSYLSAQLDKPERSHVIRALAQFHEARLEAPYFRSYGGDLESLWTGFEALCLSGESNGHVRRRANCVAKFIDDLRGVRARRIRRSERLSNAIAAELRKTGDLRADVAAGISSWAEALWVTRNHHSHAGRSQPSEFPPSEINLLRVGLSLARSLVKLRIWADDSIFFVPQVRADVDELFIRSRIEDSVIDTLRGSHAGDWLEPKRPLARSTLETLAHNLPEFNAFREVAGRRGSPDVRKARGLARRVLTKWLREVGATLPPEALGALATFEEQDRMKLKELKDRGLVGANLEDELDEYLVQHLITQGALDLDDIDASVQLTGPIKVRDWVSMYVRLGELFLGWALR